MLGLAQLLSAQSQHLSRFNNANAQMAGLGGLGYLSGSSNATPKTRTYKDDIKDMEYDLKKHLAI